MCFIIPFHHLLSLSFISVSHWMSSHGLRLDCFPSCDSSLPIVKRTCTLSVTPLQSSLYSSCFHSVSASLYCVFMAVFPVIYPQSCYILIPILSLLICRDLSDLFVFVSVVTLLVLILRLHLAFVLLLWTIFPSVRHFSSPFSSPFILVSLVLVSLVFTPLVIHSPVSHLVPVYIYPQ